MKSFVIILSVMLLAACEQQQSYTAYQPSHSDVLQNAIRSAGFDAKQCATDKKNQTYYKRYGCINDALERNIGPVAINRTALNQLKQNNLELALKIDGKKASKDEIDFFQRKYTDDFAAAEMQASANQAFYYQQQQHRQNEAIVGAMQSFGNSMQQKYTPSQQINCGTVYNAVGASTTCR